VPSATASGRVATRVGDAQILREIGEPISTLARPDGVIAQRFANNTNFATLVDPATVTENTPMITNGYKGVPLYTASRDRFLGRGRSSEAAQAELAPASPPTTRRC